MTGDGIDFSMLFTGIHSFYERLGWSIMPLSHGVARLKRSVPHPTTRSSVRMYEEKDAEAVVSIHNSFNACRPMTVVRTPDYWRQFAVDPGAEHFYIWVAEEDSLVVGYIIGHRFRNTYGAAELCCLPGHEACFSPLVREVWKRAREIRARELLYRLRKSPQSVRPYPRYRFRLHLDCTTA